MKIKLCSVVISAGSVCLEGVLVAENVVLSTQR